MPPSSETVCTSFDALSYWNGRLEEGSPMCVTGTRPFGEAYQHYLYRLKWAAIRRLLRPYRRQLQGARVLSVGCGWGYFEPLFATLGVGQITGVDFVGATISALQARRPEFEYAEADISQPLPKVLAGRTFDVVTAIDVLYHIVDESAFNQAARNLASLCSREGGLLLWTDAPARAPKANQPHCRYRSHDTYRALLRQSELVLASSTPMYHLFDVYTSWSEWLARYPRVSYPMMYAFDRLFARRGWRADTNYCYLAARSDRPVEIST